MSIKFNLWMSRAGFETFRLVVNFVNAAWKPCHITLEASETSGTALIWQKLCNLYSYISLVLADKQGLFPQISG